MKKNSALTAYFSHSGNTREIARQIHENIGGDLFEIVPVDPYPADYDAVVEQARKELDKKSRPELKTKVGNMDSYDVVFVGYPNWWGTMPMPVVTFLSEYDLSGKNHCTVLHARGQRSRAQCCGDQKDSARSRPSSRVFPSGAAM